MKSLIIAVAIALCSVACSTTSKVDSSNVTPICKPGFINGINGCYEGGS